MRTLAIDTCDRKGSVGVRVDGQCLSLRLHDEKQDYSSWLLPAVEKSMQEAGKDIRDVDLLAVATGPGSFTGVRIGLCAVKAWAEVFGKQVVGVSRLEAIARMGVREDWVTASYDAHRGQIYGGLYRRSAGELQLVEAEMVIAPEEFLRFVKEQTKGERAQWVSMVPELIRDCSEWSEHEQIGSLLVDSEAGVANSIGQLAEARATLGKYTDVLELDANYVRRSDAEIYWKGPAHRVG